MLKEILKKIGLDEKEKEIFLTVYKIGANPASIIAKNSGIKRSTTYRILDNLVQIGLVKTSTRAGIKTFFIEGEKALLRHLKKVKSEFEGAVKDYDKIESELKNLKPRELNPPKIRIYDFPVHQHGHKQIMEDMILEVERQNLKGIKLIASNTFTESTGEFKLGDIGHEFLNTLKERKISVDSITAEGISLLESLHFTQDRDILPKLPASNGASNIFIIGSTIFIVIYKENVTGVQINHRDMAQVLHFLFNQLKKIKS